MIKVSFSDIFEINRLENCLEMGILIWITNIPDDLPSNGFNDSYWIECNSNIDTPSVPNRIGSEWLVQ